VDALLPNSQAEASQIRRDFRLRSSELPLTAVVPNGVDPQLFGPKVQLLGRTQFTVAAQDFVLEVGHVSPTKNSLELIEALWDVDVPIVFVGHPSPYHPEYVDICRQRASQRSHVYFLNRVPHNELPGLYALAAVHALPSWRETPGLASLEAAAVGCRIVSTSVGSAYEYFGDSAWYCDPWDRVSIRQAVLSALYAPQTEGLRQRVLERYTWDAAAKASLATYKTVLNGGRPTS
jgi:glycosyltransferase involved in cell wall biosynthesis